MLKAALGYAAIESVGSRIFDFVTLWIVLNTLPTEDLAKFGVATSALFFFNLVFIGPETALLRFQKDWAAKGVLGKYLSAYIQFSIVKITIHLILFVGAWFVFGERHWLVYAIVFSAITQLIQQAEITRVYLRMDLQQKKVARFELTSKATLCIAALALFSHSTLTTYFLIYTGWSVVVAVIWLMELKKRTYLAILDTQSSVNCIAKSVVGFSLWAHLSGALTFYIYNSNVLYLNYFDAPVEQIALYTAVSKVTNLFFVIPMFLQSFVPVALSNAVVDIEKKFIKIVAFNGVLSLAQFIIFAALGWLMPPFFGIKGDGHGHDFYVLGLIINIGILLLNFTRPLSTYLLIRHSPSSVMTRVFIPSAVLATLAYPFGASQMGMYGSASASAIAYTFMAGTLLFMYLRSKRDLSQSEALATK